MPCRNFPRKPRMPLPQECSWNWRMNGDGMKPSPGHKINWPEWPIRPWKNSRLEKLFPLKTSYDFPCYQGLLKDLPRASRPCEDEMPGKFAVSGCMIRGILRSTLRRSIHSVQSTLYAWETIGVQSAPSMRTPLSGSGLALIRTMTGSSRNSELPPCARCLLAVPAEAVSSTINPLHSPSIERIDFSDSQNVRSSTVVCSTVGQRQR